MLDPKRLRSDAAAVAAQLARRGYVFDIERFNRLESQRKQLQTETENLQADRNTGSKRIGQAKAKGEDVSPIFADMERIKAQLVGNEAALSQLQTEFDDFAGSLPNVPHVSVPDGKSEADNVEIRRWGMPRASEWKLSSGACVGSSHRPLRRNGAAASSRCLAKPDACAAGSTASRP